MFAVTEGISLSGSDAFLEEAQVGIKYNKCFIRYDIYWNTCQLTCLQIYLDDYDNTNSGKYCEMSL